MAHLQFAAGDRLAQYEILAPLGAGGMGEVYRARDVRLGRAVALKVLLGDVATTAESLRRFEQEARAASALNHPNIVILYEVGRTESVAWMAMELIDGVDLRMMMMTERMSIRNVLRIAVKIADGLAAAHDRSIIHRDLKPENVMVTADGFVKILDFGLAKQLRITAPTDTTLPHTTPGTVFGTVGYMSPEQAVGKETDHRTDQFAFAVMLYEMLTGVRPFDRDSKPETLAAIIRDEVVPASKLASNVSPDLDRILSRCLAKNPRDRYASTRDLVRDLREIREALTSEPGRVKSGPPSSPRTSQRAWMSIAATIVVALFIGTVVMWNRQPEGAALAPAPVRSLVVMPFRDLSGTADGRLLADGMSELVAAHLGEVKELRVATAPSDSPDAAAVRRRTGADAVIRGGVQRLGDRVRVTWSLVDTRGGQTIESASVNGSARDLFALEDSVAESVLRVLQAPSPRAGRSAPSSLDAGAQKVFVEAFGIVKRARDEQSLDSAIVSLERLMGDHRDSPTINALLGRALLNKSILSGRTALVDQAIVYANRAVVLDPNNADAVTTLGFVQHASGRNEEALRSFERALELHPDMPDAVVGTADAYQALGRGSDADKAYKRALELKPEPGTAMKYGAFCLARNRKEEALRLFQRAVDLSPDSSLAHMNLGSAYHALGRSDEALAAYTRSIDISPTAGAFSNIGTIHFYARRYLEASKAYERAAQLSPSDFIMWANLGDAYRWTPALRDQADSAYGKAIATAGDAVRTNDRDAFAHCVMAVSRAKRGELAAAAKSIGRALEINPLDPVVLYQAGVIAAIEGRQDSALSWIERAIDAGYPAADVSADPELQSLRTNAAFSTLVSRAEGRG